MLKANCFQHSAICFFIFYSLNTKFFKKMAETKKQKKLAFSPLISLFVIAVFLMRKRKKWEEFDTLRNTVDESVEVRISSSGSSRKEGSSNSSNRKAVGSSRQGSDQAATPANSMKEDMVVVNEEKGIFGMVDLMRAAAEVLGNGSLGSAYKAVMGTDVAVAVKKMTEMNRIGKEGFDFELRRLGSLQHPKNVLVKCAGQPSLFLFPFLSCFFYFLFFIFLFYDLSLLVCSSSLSLNSQTKYEFIQIRENTNFVVLAFIMV